MNKKERYVFALTWVLLLFVGPLLAACGGAAQAEPDAISVRLKWLHQVQFAGFYVAEQEGYYAEDNLQVILDPVDFEQQMGIEKVLAGENDFGLAAPEELIIARSEGKPVQAIAVIFRISPEVFLVEPDAGIRSPYDFEGNKIALSPGGLSIVYAAMAQQLGLDRGQIEEIPVNVWDLWECWEIAPVCPNYATNGPVLLDQMGEPYVLIWPQDYGMAWYGDVLFTTDQMIADHPDVVRRFVHASLRGWQQAVEDPNLAVASTLVYDDQLDRDFQREAMLAGVPLIDTGELPIGTMEADVWQSIQQALLDQGLISSAVDINTVFTNEFVQE